MGSSNILTEKKENHEIFLKNVSSLYSRLTISHLNSHLLENCQPWFKIFQKFTENRSCRIQALNKKRKEKKRKKHKENRKTDVLLLNKATYLKYFSEEYVRAKYWFEISEYLGFLDSVSVHHKITVSVILTLWNRLIYNSSLLIENNKKHSAKQRT